MKSWGTHAKENDIGCKRGGNWQERQLHSDGLFKMKQHIPDPLF